MVYHFNDVEVMVLHVMDSATKKKKKNGLHVMS